MAEPMNVNRGQPETPADALKKFVDSQMEEMVNRRKGAVEAELAGPQDFWDIYAIGPYQLPNTPPPWPVNPRPYRLIQLGEKAYIVVVVWLNPIYPQPIPACANMTTHNDKIELFFYTMNTEQVKRVPALEGRVCIPTVPYQCWYTYVWEIDPTEAACLYETNICARVCNCANQMLPEYSAFVRWVEDLDYDHFFPPQGFVFDHPIRYMVSDPKDPCKC